jgi:hypothetical protein
LSPELGIPTKCRLAVALAFLALAGCQGTPAARWPTSRPIDVPATDLHVWATAQSITVVEDLEVLSDGSVWVQNSVDPFFVGFALQGDVLAAHGRAGGGPEEFGAPAGFALGGLGGEAWVFDRRRHALIRVSSLGGAREEVPLPRDAIPAGSVTTGMSLMGSTIRTARLGDEVLLPRRSGMDDVDAGSFWTTIWNADLVAFDPESRSVRTVVSIREAMGDLTPHFEGLSGGFPPFPLWYRLWAVCGDEVRLYDFVRNELRGFTAEGVELYPLPVPAPFTEATPRQFARAAFDIAVADRAGAVIPGMAGMSAADSMQILNGVVERLEGNRRQLAGLLPKYVDFRCADDGTMWLRPLDLERGGMQGGPGWLRIAPDGAAKEVRFPERFDPYRFTSERIWGVLRDELDVASVAWVAAPGES